MAAISCLMLAGDSALTVDGSTDTDFVFRVVWTFPYRTADNDLVTVRVPFSANIVTLNAALVAAIKARATELFPNDTLANRDIALLTYTRP